MHLWNSARPPLGYQLSLNFKHRALKHKLKTKNPEKGNTEMSACNSPVAVVTKDLLVLFLSPGFWPLAPITEQSQPVAVHTFPSIIYTFHWSCASIHLFSHSDIFSSPSACPLFPFRNPLLPSHVPFFLQPSTVACAAQPCTDARSCIITPTDAIPPSGSNQT